MKWNSQFFSLKCCSLKYQTFYFTYIFWAYWLNEFSLTVNACACDARVIMNANTYISFGNDFSIIQPLNLTVCDRCSRHLLNNHSHGLGLVHTNPQYHRNPLWLVFHDIHNDQRRMRSPSLHPIHHSIFGYGNSIDKQFFLFICWKLVEFNRNVVDEKMQNVKLLHLHRVWYARKIHAQQTPFGYYVLRIRHFQHVECHCELSSWGIKKNWSIWM